MNHERYTTFLFEIDYDENLPVYFNNNYKFLKSHVNNLVRHTTNGLFEKSNIKWMTFDDLRKERGAFRSYYRNVVDVILENEDDIASKLQNKKQRKRATATKPTPIATKPTPIATKPTATHKTRRYNNYKYSDNDADAATADSYKTTTSTIPLLKSKSKPRRKSKKRRREKTKTTPASNNWFQW